MFYKYTVTYPNGTQLSGYAESDKPMPAVKAGIASNFFGNFDITVEKHGNEFPKVNSDYIMTIR